jgi:hypothetical protein
MFMHRDIAWWYWAATAASLVAGIAGWPEAFFLATALGVAQILHFWVREGRLIAFPVQVRVVFTAALLLCAWTPLNDLYWLPAAGALARVLFGYCLLARTLSLMPGNRRMPLTWTLAWRTYTSPPVDGSIVEALSTPPLGQRSARHEPHV